MIKTLTIAFVLAIVFFSVQVVFETKNEFFGSILSPAAESENETQATYSHWEPNIPKVGGASASRFLMTAQAAISYDVATDTLIFEENSNMRLPMASLTKIMTALLALEEGMDKRYRVSERAAGVGENSMGLSSGEVFTLEELLYGLLLPSGNDAAEVIAEGSRYGRNGFVEEMNKRAKQMGLTDTNFTNPSGLEGDGEQYSTAIDLLKLTKIAMQNPEFRKIVGTYEIEMPRSKDHKYYHLYNETNLLTSYPGVKGVKTGFTWEAGLCLVTYLEHEKREIIAVLLNSKNRRQEMKNLLDYSLTRLGETPPEHE